MTHNWRPVASLAAHGAHVIRKSICLLCIVVVVEFFDFSKFLLVGATATKPRKCMNFKESKESKKDWALHASLQAQEAYQYDKGWVTRIAEREKYWTTTRAGLQQGCL